MTETKSARRRGRPTRKELGLPPTKQISAMVEVETLAKCLEVYGNVNKALKAAVKAAHQAA